MLYNLGIASSRNLFKGLSNLAAHAELRRAVRGHSTPVRLVLSLAIVTDARRLLRLVEGLEVEDIEAPVEHAAHTLRPVRCGICGTCNGVLVVGAT